MCALVVINPSNPTGPYLTEREYTRIVRVCLNHGMPLIADDVFYNDALASPADRVEVAGRDDVRTQGLALKRPCTRPGDHRGQARPPQGLAPPQRQEGAQ
ncbi:aminotransferase class I/II-fold pyridoxal phosphate-dependent enzyme [Actinomyces respiraculi]|uniref:Aminotransferase class I/II-fold pyridoxal phosphate-dependent enzyme n=2 Tax=Actinomycetaceae TaxID=2049 RepID=A0A7T0LL49_9ACTO|nr:aminotransferase class I/II-fold pyridoxal phosphate-dependent enzyme [Actinomyces respiraculi]